jgi:hypothetical protein
MKFRPLARAAILSGVFTVAMLLGSLATPPSQGTIFGTYAARAALADEDGNRGDENCIGPAGHERGRCDRGDGEQNEHHRKHRKHRKHHGQGSLQDVTISGTVLSVNGNTAQVRLDNGGTITVDTAGTQVGVGQHLALNGCYQNGIFVVDCNGTQNGNGNGYGRQQVRGTILSVSGNIVMLVGLPPVRVDFTRAQANNAIAGQLTIARSITVYGYSQNGTFYASSIR